MVRTLSIGACAVFTFLALLLILSRIPLLNTLDPYIQLLAALVICLSVIRWAANIRNVASALSAILAFALVIVAWAYATSWLYSPGDDDYGYHIWAVWELANGWKPFETANDNIWLDSYPSGIYVLESYIVATTKLLLSGQSLTIGLIVVVALQSFAFFDQHIAPHLNRFRTIAGLIFSALIVANPVVLLQVMTHYVDAPLYLMGAGLILFLLADTFQPNKLDKLGAICCILLMVNTKSAALYFTPLIVIAAFISSLVLDPEKQGFITRAFNWVIRKGAGYALVFFFGVLVIGYKPFVTNYLDHGKVLYPAVDQIMKGNVPENILTLPAPVKFVYGIGAVTGESYWPTPFHAPISVKVPGTFSIDEFKHLRYDTRRGGFGPLFSFALIASVLAWTAAIVSRPRMSAPAIRKAGAIGTLSLVLLVGCAFFPESWWARYVPFVWMSTVLFAASSLVVTGKGVAIHASRICVILSVAAFSLCVLAATGGALRQNYKTYHQVLAFAHLSKYPLVEIYPENDPRISKDYQSTTITNAGEVWGKLIEERGTTVEIIKKYGNEVPGYKTRCKPFGWLDADVLWCVPAHAEN